jgi:hypothetical protein
MRTRENSDTHVVSCESLSVRCSGRYQDSIWQRGMFESTVRARTAHKSFAEFVVADAGRAVCYASEALLIYVYPVCLVVNAVPSVE